MKLTQNKTHVLEAVFTKKKKNKTEKNNIEIVSSCYSRIAD